MRADLYLVRYGFAESRTLAQKLIADGAVSVDGRTIRKPSEDIPERDPDAVGGGDSARAVTIRATADTRYVGRGGLKLEAALAAFDLPVTGCVVADIGASTGGFTECLLQSGAAVVYAVDAGHGQLHPRLRADDRVRVAEGMNARGITPADIIHMEDAWRAAHPHAPHPAMDGRVDGCVMDVSFISQTLLHPAIAGILNPGGWFVALIKPQFELDAHALGKRGVVKRESDHRAAVRRVTESAEACGFFVERVIPSPIEGGDGNREFLALFRKIANA